MDLPVFIYIRLWCVSMEGLAFLHLKSFSSFMHNYVPYINSFFFMDRKDMVSMRIYADYCFNISWN